MFHRIARQLRYNQMRSLALGLTSRKARRFTSMVGTHIIMVAEYRLKTSKRRGCFLANKWQTTVSDIILVPNGLTDKRNGNYFSTHPDLHLVRTMPPLFSSLIQSFPLKNSLPQCPQRICSSMRQCHEMILSSKKCTPSDEMWCGIVNIVSNVKGAPQSGHTKYISFLSSIISDLLDVLWDFLCRTNCYFVARKTYCYLRGRI